MGVSTRPSKCNDDALTSPLLSMKTLKDHLKAIDSLTLINKICLSHYK